MESYLFATHLVTLLRAKNLDRRKHELFSDGPKKLLPTLFSRLVIWYSFLPKGIGYLLDKSIFLFDGSGLCFACF